MNKVLNILSDILKIGNNIFKNYNNVSDVTIKMYKEILLELIKLLKSKNIN